MDDSTSSNHVPVHANVKTHDVVFRNEQNDDTEILFQGTEVVCRIYVQGYVHALVSETAYYIHPDSPGNSVIVLYSPLVSQWKIHIWVEECQPVEDTNSFEQGWDSAEASNLLI